MIHQKANEKFKFYLGVIALLLFLDLTSKFIIKNTFEPFDGFSIIPYYIDIIYIINEGALHSLFQGTSFIIGLLYIPIQIIIVFGLLFFYNKDRVITIGLLFFLSGGLGNNIERLFSQGVTDFICLFNFPIIFNIADVYLFIGLIMLLARLHILIRELDSYIESKQQRRKVA